MHIERIEGGFFKTNTYLVVDEATHAALLIDPAGNWRDIQAALQSTGARVVAIVNTHTHYDHASRNHEAKKHTGAPIGVHRAEAEPLRRFSLASLLFRGRARLSPPADRVLDDGDEIEVGALRFEVIHTPGHSPGGLCLRHKKNIFSGDTLLAGSIGRTDLPGGNYDQLVASIRDRLFVLSDDIHVHPGHGPRTTLEAERKYNLFVKLRPEQIEEIFFGPAKKKPAPEPENG